MGRGHRRREEGRKDRRKGGKDGGKERRKGGEKNEGKGRE
jgi:hypothetical protein